MGKSLIVLGGNVATTTANTTQYFPIGGSLTAFSTTEANHRVPLRSPGTLTNLIFYISASNTNNNSTFRTRKNGSNGSLSVTIPSSTTGWFEDTTNSESISAGDQVNYQCVPSTTGTMTFRIIAVTFTPTDSSITVSRLILNEQTAINASVIYYNTLYGLNLATVTATTNLRYMPGIGGDFKHWALYSSVGGRAVTTRLVKNNSDDLTTRGTLANNTTGLNENTSDTITIDNDDDVTHLHVYGGSGTSRTVDWMALSFINTNENKSIWLLGKSDGNAQNSATTAFYAIAGRMIATTSAEANCQMKMKDSYAVSQLRIRISQHSINTGNSTVRSRKNGSNGNMSITIPNGSTGTFEDNSNSDSLTVNDLYCYSIVTPGTSGTLTPTFMGVIAEWLPPQIPMTNTSTKTLANKFITKV